MKPRNRMTFKVSFEIDPFMGWKPWHQIRGYNGFEIYAGIFGMNIRINLVRRNYGF